MYREQLRKWYEQAKEILEIAEYNGLCKVKYLNITPLFTPEARDKDGWKIWSLTAFAVEWKLKTGTDFEAARAVMSKLLLFMPAQQWESDGGSTMMSNQDKDESGFSIYFKPYTLFPPEWDD